MGKSPGKWIKAVLFGKKSSKSNLSKEKAITKSLTQKASPVSNKELASKMAVDSFSVSEPVPCPIAATGNCPESEDEDTPRLPSIGLILSLPKQDGDGQTATDLDLPEDSERMRLEQAAIKAQAAFRGYLARRAFQSLDCIIRLQAVIRGHLVRRQAVSTLHGIHSIVKFQAFVRGQLVRCSDIGIQVCTKLTLEEKDAKHLEPGKTNKYNQAEELLKNAFVTKLLSLSPTPLPLNLQYGQEEPDSTWHWLLRWTLICIWERQPETKKVVSSKHRRVETGQATTKRSMGRLHHCMVENSSNHSMTELGKQKHNPRRVSDNSINSVQGYPQNEIEKFKRNPKKISNSKRYTSIQIEVAIEEQGQNHGKGLNHPAPQLSEHSTDNEYDKLHADLEGNALKQADQVKCAELPATCETMNEVIDHPVSNSDEQPKMSGKETENFLAVDKHFKDDLTGDENIKVGKRRASLPAKNEDQAPAFLSPKNSKDDQTGSENHKVNNRGASLLSKHYEQDVGLPCETRVPSYMAATESAKAKVRCQASPRFGQDAYEKNLVTRRYSLPFSTNVKATSSPRVQSLVQASGKGGNRIDRSLSSSRDGTVQNPIRNNIDDFIW